MMFVGMSKFGKMNLTFVDPGVKTNGTYCRGVLLTEQLLPVTRHISDEFLSSAKTVLLHTSRTRQLAFCNG